MVGRTYVQPQNGVQRRPDMPEPSVTVTAVVCSNLGCCCQVIMRDPQHKETHLKALFRRGKARAAMGRTQEALEDLNAAAAL